MNCSDMILQFISHYGVDRIYGVPGYANSPLLISTLKFPNIKPILTKHEANAAWMAYGYALASGKFGVCTGTSGAGTTNILSGVTAAYYNSIPMLVITGQVETTKFGKGAFQELTGEGARSVNVTKLFENTTKMSFTVKDPKDLPEVLTKALVAMLTGRPGPVHIDVPVDIQKAICHDSWEAPILPREESPNPRDIHKTIELLKSAKAPLLLFGRGCREERSKAAALELIEHINIPYCTTIQGRGLIPENEAGYLGIVGVAGSPRCNLYIAEACDLIIAIGSSLSEFTTNAYAESFCRPNRLVHVNVDPLEFGKSMNPHLAVKADAGGFCHALVTQIKQQKLSLGHGSNQWSGYLEKNRTVPVPRIHDVEGKVSPMEIMELIEKHAPDNAIILADSGNNAIWAAHYLSLKPGQDFFFDVNTGCMGSGIISAIGAKMAAPDRPVLVVCGDGGFMMNGIDITTAADHELPIIWLVMNDFKIGMVDQGFRGKYGASVACEYTNSDIAAMGRAYGAESLVIHSAEDLGKALEQIHTLSGPMVLDVRFNDKYLPAVYERVKATPEDVVFANAIKAQATTNKKSDENNQ